MVAHNGHALKSSFSGNRRFKKRVEGGTTTTDYTAGRKLFRVNIIGFCDRNNPGAKITLADRGESSPLQVVKSEYIMC